MSEDCVSLGFPYVTGGTLGLFTGMSLLSIIELMYWLLKMLKKLKDLIVLKIARAKEEND